MQASADGYTIRLEVQNSTGLSRQLLQDAIIDLIGDMTDDKTHTYVSQSKIARTITIEVVAHKRTYSAPYLDMTKIRQLEKLIK